MPLFHCTVASAWKCHGLRKEWKCRIDVRGWGVLLYPHRTPHPRLSSWDRGTVGVDWFDVLMHCLMTGSSKWRMPLWCLSIGGHEKRHLAPELRVMADSGFKGSRRAGRWLRSCHIIHSAWPFIFLESVPLPRQPAWLKRSQPLGSWTTTLCNCTCNLFNARIPWGK